MTAHEFNRTFPVGEMLRVRKTGYPCRTLTPALSIAEGDSVVVARLLASGALIVGSPEEFELWPEGQTVAVADSAALMMRIEQLASDLIADLETLREVNVPPGWKPVFDSIKGLAKSARIGLEGVR